MKGDKALILGLGLLALGGTRALQAAEVIGTGQEQARSLLSGRDTSSYGPQSVVVSRSSVPGKSIAPDAQEQAREMILGRQSAETSTIEADEARVAGARRERKVAWDPQELGRVMILGRQSAVSEPKIRLTSKPE
jgi:hypothetical protein